MASHELWAAGPPLLGIGVRGVGLSRDFGKALLFLVPFVVIIAVLGVEAVVSARVDGVPRLHGPAIDIVGTAPIVYLFAAWLICGLVCVTVAATTFRSFGRPLTTRRAADEH